MRYSEIALKVLAAKECGIIKTNAQFWRNYAYEEKFCDLVLNDERVKHISENLLTELNLVNGDEGIICAFDDEFPIINRKVIRNGDKPFLLFYKGDLSLLSNLNQNVAVIGLVDPNNDITIRETDIIKKLVSNGLVIVSGLAKGCDTTAHKVCLENNGKTIAILPSQLSKVYPSENRELAEEIVEKGGLLLSEYYKDSASRYEAINRFIERDRLQAMFSKAIVMIASYRKGEGDSGSRHAMEAAMKYEIERYVMYNSKTDESNLQFGLNRDLVNINSVKIITTNSIDEIRAMNNPNLYSNKHSSSIEQLKLL